MNLIDFGVTQKHFVTMLQNILLQWLLREYHCLLILELMAMYSSKNRVSEIK